MGFLFISIVATRVENPPVIDGLLNDKCWKGAVFIDSFVQCSPNDSDRATLKTTFSILYDNNFLYIGVKSYQNPSTIVTRISRRDRVRHIDDKVSIQIDPTGKARGVYFFIVNPSGSIRDGYFSDYMDDSWNGVWDVKTHTDSSAWTAELRIPFHIMRFEVKDTMNLKIKVTRHIAYLDETDEYPYIPSDVSNVFVYYAPVKGIYGIHTGLRTIITPYIRAGVFPDTREYNWSVGVDNQFRIGSDYIIDMSINPDFCQVEADPHQLNLETYEIFYPEHRPFFIEGKEMFSSYPEIFYSRRIGKLDYFESTDSIVSIPDAATILSAIKFTSKRGKHQTGLLYAVTDREYAELIDTSGNVYQEMIQPLRHYMVLMNRIDFSPDAYARIMNATEIDNSLCGGMAWLIDGSFPLKRNLLLMGSYSLSYNDTILKVNPGKAVYLSSNYSGKWYSLFLTGTYMDTLYDVNRTGYNSRNDLRGLNSGFAMWNNRRISFLNSIYSQLRFTYYENLNGEPTDKFLYYSVSTSFTNKHSLSISMNYSPSHYDDLLTRGGPSVYLPSHYGYFIFYGTDRTRMFACRFVYGTGISGESITRRIELILMGAPSKMGSFRITYSISTTKNPYQWVTNVFDTTTNSYVYVFGDLDRLENTLETRMSFNPSTNLSFQLWARTYMDRGIYRRIKKLEDPDTPSFSDYTIDYNPDFLMKSIQIHSVLRWEYRKGSEFYLVYTKDLYSNIYETRESIPVSELLKLFKWHGGNKVSAKITYRFNI